MIKSEYFPVLFAGTGYQNIKSKTEPQAIVENMTQCGTDGINRQSLLGNGGYSQEVSRESKKEPVEQLFR